jgi:uncharacterized 2Fe-2S/4Fe-4S cluster protein (DUF4445 family)
MKVRVKLTFNNQKKEIEIEKGKTLAEVILKAGFKFELPCGGNGTCGRCLVKAKGKLFPPDESEITSLEEGIEKGFRLACRCRVCGEVEVFWKEAFQPAKILTEGLSKKSALRPNVTKTAYKIAVSNKKVLAQELKALFEKEGLSLEKDLNLSGFEEVKEDTLTAILRDGKVSAVENGDTTSKCFGLVIDIGTTTLVVSLVDLNSGKEVDTVSDLNPQVTYGHDVVTRITQVKREKGNLFRLQKMLVSALGEMIQSLCQKHKAFPENIYEVAVAGNTCMMHLFLGFDPVPLALAPYTSLIERSLYIDAKELGFKNLPQAKLYILPPISPYVGADITAGILATDLCSYKEPTLFIDIGTNGEIALKTRNETLACSTAAGPAFEGMNISCGMRAEKGAIEGVTLEEDGPKIRTIGGDEPRGICGSGLIDIVAELREKGVIDSRGRFSSETAGYLGRLLREENGKKHFILFENGERKIFISQKDIRQVQLAKEAIQAGINLLLQAADLKTEEIQRVFIAGAFGYHLKAASLVKIGLLPEEWEDKVSFAGNTAKTGSLLVLLDKVLRKEAERIAKSVKTLDLVTHPQFERDFIKSMLF